MNKNKFEFIIDENDVVKFKAANKFTVAESIGVLCYFIIELSQAIKLPAEQILNDMIDAILFSEGCECNDKEEKGPMREGEQVSDSAGI